MNLEIEGVGKQYRGRVWGLRDFTLALGPGILGLLGPNGAGKSTLMRIIATVTRPTSGRVRWNGVDTARAPDDLRRALGYLPQDFGVYPQLNPVEFLEYLAAVKGIEAKAARRRIEELLIALNLADVRGRPLGQFSGGMKQRVGIAQALLNDPRLLIVDEPTAGLDPAERVRFRHLLSELAGDRVVILSTHVVSDVEATAGSIAVIARGRLVTHGAPERLLESVTGRVWELEIAPSQLTEMRQRYRVSGVLRRADRVHLRVLSESAPTADARPAAPSLEEAYLNAIESSEREGARPARSESSPSAG